jgi:hypothetical protein
MAPIFPFISLFLILLLDVLLFKLAGSSFPRKRKYVVPFLLTLLLWPTIQGYWELKIGSDFARAAYKNGYPISCSGLWYTFDTRQPVAGFIYRHWDYSIPWTGLLALVDVGLLAVPFCLATYLIVLIYRRIQLYR